MTYVTSVGVGQPDVEHNGSERRAGSGSGGGEGAGAVDRRRDLQSVFTKTPGDRGPESRIVLDEKHGRIVHGFDSASSPSVRWGLRTGQVQNCPRTLRDMTDTSAAARSARTLLNKVPEVTVFFWVIKILATTVGETAADFLATNLGLGLGGTTLIMSVLFLVVLGIQFRTPRYVPGVYWLTVVLISVVGTLVTDNLTDGLGVSLTTSTIVFAGALTLTFLAWYASERTLSIHTIVTSRREAFYWLAILFTFALGTAAGDLVDEQFGLGYWTTALLVAAIIAAITAGHLVFRAGAVLSFWAAYVLTRPLGASLGDGFSQAKTDGGLGLGTTGTSAGFLVVILAVVSYLAVTRRDQTAPVPAAHDESVSVGR